MNFKKYQKQFGFTFVEVVVGTTIFLIVMISVYSLFNLSLKWTAGMKARVEAASIAQGQLEMIRNMAYEDIKTVNGWSPAGVIPNSQDITRAGINFQMNTTVSYVNDPFDGTSAASNPPDLLPFDYKKVEVKVTWPALVGGNKPVVFNTIVAPKGLEGMAPGKGGIWIKVFDAQGNGIDGASVHVENTNLDPDYIVNTTTDSSGNVFLTDLTPDTQNYQAVVTKATYSTERTYSVADLAAMGYAGATPSTPPLSVVAEQVTEQSFSIDLLGSLALSTVNENIPSEFKVSTEAGVNNQDAPHVAIDGTDKLYFAWHDGRGGSKNYGQKYNLAGSNLWGSDQIFSNENNQQSPRTAIALDGNLYVAWYDARNGNQDVYLSKYSNVAGTELWTGSKKVNTDAGSADQMRPDIVVDSLGNILIAWVDNRNGNNDIYLHKLDSSGNALWGSEIKVNSDLGTTEQDNPVVLVDNASNNIFVAWTDNRNGDQDVYMNKFDPNGTRLWANDVKVNTNTDASNQSVPDAVIDNVGNIYVVWSDERNGVNDIDVYAQKYDSSGIRASSGIWVGGDLRINSDNIVTRQDNPSITIDGGNNIFIAWADERNISISSSDIYLQKFNSDGGIAWQGDVRINTDLGQNIQSNPEVAMLSDGRVVIAWQDGRNTDLDIYAAIYSEPGTTVRANVPLKVYIAKLIGTDSLGDPIYKYTGNVVTDGNGILNMDNLEWGNYYIEVTGGLYTLLSTTPIQPITLNPNTTQAVKINVSP